MLRRREPWEPQDLATMGPPPLPGPDTAIALPGLEPPPPVPSLTGSRTLQVCSRQIRHVIACLCSWRRRPALCLYLWNSRGNLSLNQAQPSWLAPVTSNKGVWCSNPRHPCSLLPIIMFSSGPLVINIHLAQNLSFSIVPL